MFKDVLSLPFKLIYIYFSPVSYKTMLMSVLTFLFDAITETESERVRECLDFFLITPFQNSNFFNEVRLG